MVCFNDVVLLKYLQLRIVIILNHIDYPLLEREQNEIIGIEICLRAHDEHLRDDHP